MRLTLLIPELLWSEPGDTEANAPAHASALTKILSRCRFGQQINQGWEASLLKLAGLSPTSSLAVLRAVGEASPLLDAAPDAAYATNSRRWLCADPVHLRFHQDRLILADGNELGLESDELNGLAARLNAELAGRAEFFFTSPTRGYARLATTPAKAPPAGEALSRKIGCEVRPSDFGSDAELRGLANEIQMLLHADPLNQSRAATGQPAVNALWLWGSGEAPVAAHEQTLDAIAGQHPLIGGIAKTLGITRLDAISLNQSGAKHALQLIDTLSTPTHYQNSLDYAAAWQSLDQTHFAPVLGALRQWRLKQLDIVAPVVFGELHWQLAPTTAWLKSFGQGRWQAMVTTLAEQGLTGKSKP